MLNELIKRATAKAKTVSVPNRVGLTRAVKKWSRIAEELEIHMLKSPSSSSSISHSFNSKRRLDVSSTFIDLQQRQRRRIDAEADVKVHSLDSAMISLMRRHSMGVAIDEAILDQLLCIPRNKQQNLNVSSKTYFKYLGPVLIEHPFAIDALMHALYFPGGRKSISLKVKCAKLVAMAVIASEKKLIEESLDDEDKSEEWVRTLHNQSTQDIDLIANVRDSTFVFLFNLFSVQYPDLLFGLF